MNARKTTVSTFLLKSDQVPQFPNNCQENFNFMDAQIIWLLHDDIKECYLYINFPEAVCRNTFRGKGVNLKSLANVGFQVQSQQKNGQSAKKCLYDLLYKKGWQPEQDSAELVEQFKEEFENDNKEIGDWTQQEPDRPALKERTIADEFIHQLNLGQVRTADKFISTMICQNPKVSIDLAKHENLLRKMEENYHRAKCLDQSKTSLRELLSQFIQETTELPTFEESIERLKKVRQHERSNYSIHNPYLEVLWHIASKQVRGSTEVKKRTVWLYGTPNSGKTRLLRVLNKVFKAHNYKPGKNGYDIYTARDAEYQPMATWDEISPNQDFREQQWDQMKDFTSGQGIVINPKYSQQMVVFKESWIVIASNLLPEVIDLEKFTEGGEMIGKGAPTDKEGEFIDKHIMNIKAFNARVKKFRFDISYEEQESEVQQLPFDAESVAVILKEFVSRAELGQSLEETLRINATQAGSIGEPVDSFRQLEPLALTHMGAPQPTPFTLKAYEQTMIDNKQMLMEIDTLNITITKLEQQVNHERNRADNAELSLKAKHQEQSIELQEMKELTNSIVEEQPGSHLALEDQWQDIQLHEELTNNSMLSRKRTSAMMQSNGHEPVVKKPVGRKKREKVKGQGQLTFGSSGIKKMKKEQSTSE